uniref:Beta-1,4-galactosyltransferase n=1 Tax=Callorhinus ursinus TaxID=34884 RepID=A0A3Q7MQ50_CALUR|nr:beta-1,4-galactosyltransferase 5 isoform X1 [Callorhinus ursinus]
MMQAQGILIRDNMRTIGAQVYEQVVRSAYAKRNSSMNDSDYPLDLNHSETFLQTTTFLPEDFTYFANHTCPERLPSMKGPIDINMSEIAMDDIHEIFSKDPAIKLGGHWKPSDCVPRWKVAILIPFRNRHEHLPVLLRHLIPMLQRQRLRFAFYVVEQVGTQPFNRAMLFNVGFQEAMKDLDWDCLIFHDVDHIPESDRNYYGCGQMPRHFATKLDKYMYLLPYAEFFGGVSGLTVEQFRKINGFPNAFWGWGGEDDDLWNSYHQDFSPKEIAERFQAAVHQHSRFLTSPPALVIDNLLRFATFQPLSSHVWLEAACTGQRSSRQFFSQSERVQNAGYSVSRPEGDTGKYKSIPHHHRGEVQFLGRYALLRKSKERQGLDGLNNLNYFANVTHDALYKNITVNLTPELAQDGRRSCHFSPLVPNPSVPSQPGSPEQQLTSPVVLASSPFLRMAFGASRPSEQRGNPTTGLF